MTDLNAPLGAARVESRPLPSFWVLHAGGWLAYGVAMTFSRIGIYPLTFMIAVKTTLMISGFLISLLLRYAYRPLIRRGTPLITLVVIAVVASYLASMIWTASDNLLALKTYPAFGFTPPVFRTLLQMFGGTVYNAFAM